MTMDVQPRTDGQAHASFSASAAKEVWTKGVRDMQIQYDVPTQSAPIPDHVQTMFDRGALAQGHFEKGWIGLIPSSDGEVEVQAGESFPIGKLVKEANSCSIEPVTPMRPLSHESKTADKAFNQ